MGWQAACAPDRRYRVACILQACVSRPEGHLWSAVLRVGFLADSTAFPQGSIWRERPPKGECLSCATVCAGERSPVPHQRPKKGGRSLHQHPVSCGAPARWARRGRAGCGPPGFVAEEAGNPWPTRFRCGFPAKACTTAGGLRPLRVERWGCQKRAPPACTTLLCSRVTHTTAPA